MGFLESSNYQSGEKNNVGLEEMQIVKNLGRKGNEEMSSGNSGVLKTTCIAYPKDNLLRCNEREIISPRELYLFTEAGAAVPDSSVSIWKTPCSVNDRLFAACSLIRYLQRHRSIDKGVPWDRQWKTFTRFPMLFPRYFPFRETQGTQSDDSPIKESNQEIEEHFVHATRHSWKILKILKIPEKRIEFSSIGEAESDRCRYVDSFLLGFVPYCIPSSLRYLLIVRYLSFIVNVFVDCATISGPDFSSWNASIAYSRPAMSEHYFASAFTIPPFKYCFLLSFEI